MGSVFLVSGEAVFFDDQDQANVSKYSWSRKKGKKTLYAQAWIEGKRTSMHRFLLGARRGEQVDHRDGNGLNNRRQNLRLATTSQNCANQPKRKHNTSGYKGVYWMKTHSKWRATIMHNGKKIHLGLFASAEEAHEVFVVAAKKFFGEFAHV